MSFFEFKNACSPLYLGFAIFLGLKLPNALELLKRNKIKLILGFYLLLLVIKFPYSSSLFPLYEGNRANYNESKIPFYRWHRFLPEELKYYEDLYSFMCDGRKKIINLTMDSTIPYLCPDQENSLGLPFYHPPMLRMIHSEKFESKIIGDFSEDELIVAEIPVEGNKLPINPDIQLIEIGKTKRPASIRFYGANTISVYRVEKTK
jgi:hypothetical protein